MSIIDVAKTAGVSTATVSRVLNRQRGVDAGTFKNVMETARKLGYSLPKTRPGPKNLEQNPFCYGSVAVILGRYSLMKLYSMHSESIDLIEALEKRLGMLGVGVAVYSWESLKRAPFLHSDNIKTDGIFVLGVRPENVARLRNMARGVPVVGVGIDVYACRDNFDCVGSDFRDIGNFAADYFLAKKYRSVACLCPYLNHPLHNNLTSAFIERMNGSDTQLDCYLWENMEELKGCHHSEIVPHMVNKIISKKTLPQAVFLSYANRAAEAYPIFKAAGIEPMRDFEAVCYCVNYHARELNPLPTIIDLNHNLMADRAIELMKWRIRNKNEKSKLNVFIEPKIHTK